MKILKGIAAAFAALMTFAISPSVAGQVELTSAEKIKKLDIMLMVSSLRCRSGPNNFRPAYQRFNARHLQSLNGAHQELSARLVADHGNAGAKKALDRLGVSMANQYGQGHPWMNCKQLSAATAELADAGGQSELLGAAETMLSSRPSLEAGAQFVAR